MIASGSSIFGVSLRRQKTRRWLLGIYWCGLIPLFCIGFSRFAFGSRGGNSFVLNCAIWAAFWVAAVLGGVRAGGWVKPFRPQRPMRGEVQPLFSRPEPTPGELVAQEVALDERETMRRDHIHFAAYSILQIAVYIVFLAYLVVGMWRQELLGRLGLALLFLLTLASWSLPQSIILWTEPDMEEQ